MGCEYVFLKIVFFLVHSLVHLFGYLTSRGLRLLCRLLVFQPCRRKCARNYIERPEDQVRVSHNRELTEVVKDVFGLVDVKESTKEDRQYCCTTKEEEKALKAEAGKKMLFFNGFFYNPHISTILGVNRPTTEIAYAREETHSWDGCPIALDWLYVDGTRPLHVHSTSAVGSSVRQDSVTTLGEPYSEEEGIPYLPRCGATSATSQIQQTNSKSQTPVFSSAPESLSPPDSHSSVNKSVDSEPHCIRFTPLSDVNGLVVLLPGLTSDSQTGYIRRCVRSLHDAHYHVCVVNTRGFGGTAASLPFMINSAYTRDFRSVVQRFFTKDAIRIRFGCALPVIGFGLSNGGATLSKFLGECGRDGEEPHLDAGITCCAPNDFVSVVEHMNRGTMQKLIYQPQMCNDVRSYVLRHEEFQRIPNIDREYIFTEGNIHRFSRIVHFDEHIFCKTSGYRSLHQYHLDASPILWLPYTPVPTLVLATFDDPVIGRTVMPHRWQEICANNPRLVSVEVRPGGHLGFLGGPIDELLNRPDWMHRFVCQRLDAVSAYWRRIQEHPEESSGMMPLLSETWAKLYKDMNFAYPSQLPSPSACAFPVNSPYFTDRTTKPLPKDRLYRPYFDSSDPELRRRSLMSNLKESSIALGDIEKFNEKSRPIAEVLQTASRVPILVNCDYYVDPRVYMMPTPGMV